MEKAYLVICEPSERLVPRFQAREVPEEVRRFRAAALWERFWSSVRGAREYLDFCSHHWGVGVDGRCYHVCGSHRVIPVRPGIWDGQAPLKEFPEAVTRGISAGELARALERTAPGSVYAYMEDGTFILSEKGVLLLSALCDAFAWDFPKLVETRWRAPNRRLPTKGEVKWSLALQLYLMGGQNAPARVTSMFQQAQELLSNTSMFSNLQEANVPVVTVARLRPTWEFAPASKLRAAAAVVHQIGGVALTSGTLSGSIWSDAVLIEEMLAHLHRAPRLSALKLTVVATLSRYFLATGSPKAEVFFSVRSEIPYLEFRDRMLDALERKFGRAAHQEVARELEAWEKRLPARVVSRVLSRSMALAIVQTYPSNTIVQELAPDRSGLASASPNVLRMLSRLKDPLERMNIMLDVGFAPTLRELSGREILRLVARKLLTLEDWQELVSKLSGGRDFDASFYEHHRNRTMPSRSVSGLRATTSSMQLELF